MKEAILAIQLDEVNVRWMLNEMDPTDWRGEVPAALQLNVVALMIPGDFYVVPFWF